MDAKESNSPSLTVKQRDCAQRNSLLRHTNQRISVSIQNEHTRFAKNMDFEAKKLRKKLTLMMPWTKPNGMNDVRSPTREEPSEDTLKLPIIRSQPKSAPCSPNLGRNKTNFSCDNLSISPPGPEAWALRRGSFNDIDSPRNSPVISRKMSRSFSYRGERRPTLVPPLSPGSEDGNVKVSPLLPRNLKLREQARRESSASALKAFTTDSNAGALSPTLEDQFKSLGTCRYLRRATEGDVKDVASEAPDT